MLILENNNYCAKMLCDSISPDGVRLSTMEITFPRIVLAEFNTHRMLSRNSASSRAIPVEKQLKRVEENPFIPEYWGRNQKGMQADQELEEGDKIAAEARWKQACKSEISTATDLMKIGVHKQLANRRLEIDSWHTVIVSATEWSNFFALRCHRDAQPEIRRIAVLMRELLEMSIPRKLGYRTWHLPLIQPDEIFDWTKENPGKTYEKVVEFWKKVSVGRCARVSYLTHDGKRDLDADLRLCESLRASGHMCYDDKTEVLTANGWKYWPEVNEHDLLFTIDLESQYGRFERPIKVHKFEISEPLYSIVGQQIDLKVTMNHNMVTSYRKNDGTWSKFGLEKASSIQNKPRRYLKSAIIDEPDITYFIPPIIPNNLRSAYFKLLGFFIGDGHCSAGSDRIEFHLKKKRKIDFLKNIGFKINSLSHDKYTIDFPGLGKIFDQMCYTPDRVKKLPDTILHIKPKDAEDLFEGLKNSDGSKKRNTWTYYSTSKFVIDSLQALLHIHGKVGSITKSITKYGIYFKINVSNRTMPRIEPNQTGRSQTYKENVEQYLGTVFCATMSNGTLMVRRNNKVAISGNSPFEHVARPMNSGDGLIISKDNLYVDGNSVIFPNKTFLGNFRGWIQFRKELPNEHDYGLIEKS